MGQGSRDALGSVIEVHQTLYVGPMRCLVLYYSRIFYGRGGKVTRAGFIGVN